MVVVLIFLLALNVTFQKNAVSRSAARTLRFSSCCTRKCSLTLTRLRWGVVILSWCFFFFLSNMNITSLMIFSEAWHISSQQIYELGLFCFSFLWVKTKKGTILLMSTDFEDSMYYVTYIKDVISACKQNIVLKQNSSKLILSKWGISSVKYPVYILSIFIIDSWM